MKNYTEICSIQKANHTVIVLPFVCYTNQIEFSIENVTFCRYNIGFAKLNPNTKN